MKWSTKRGRQRTSIWPENPVVGTIVVPPLCPPRAKSGVEEALEKSGTIWCVTGSLLLPKDCNVQARACWWSVPATACPSESAAPLGLRPSSARERPHGDPHRLENKPWPCLDHSQMSPADVIRAVNISSYDMLDKNSYPTDNRSLSRKLCYPYSDTSWTIKCI